MGEAEPQTLKVVTLNIWNRFGPWEERLPRIRAGLSALAADIVGLQEVLVMSDANFDQRALVADGLGYEVAWGASSRARFPVGNAILSRFPIEETRVFDLPDGGTDENRCIVFARLRAPFAEIPVFVTHLNWKLDEGHIRVLQVKALVEHVNEKTRPGDFPAIVVGDFNAEPDSDEIRYLRGLTGVGGRCVYFADCFAAAGDAGAEYAGGATFGRNNPFARVCHEPNRRIDYVFVRGPDDRGRGEPLASRVCMNVATGGGFPSDHYGVYAELAR